MIYRTQYYNIEGHQGYQFFTNKSEANKSIREWEKLYEGTYCEAQIVGEYPNPKTLKEIIDLLNRVATHNDNG